MMTYVANILVIYVAQNKLNHKRLMEVEDIKLCLLILLVINVIEVVILRSCVLNNQVFMKLLNG